MVTNNSTLKPLLLKTSTNEDSSKKLRLVQVQLSIIGHSGSNDSVFYL